jgi:dihydrofolate reductase
VPHDWIEAHPDAPFTFVTSGIEEAIEVASGLAGEKNVLASGGTIARQALDAELRHEIRVELVPVIMGTGNRPFFGHITAEKVRLLNPTTCIQGDRVTHLVFAVQRHPPREGPS